MSIFGQEVLLMTMKSKNRDELQVLDIFKDARPAGHYQMMLNIQGKFGLPSGWAFLQTLFSLPSIKDEVKEQTE